MAAVDGAKWAPLIAADLNLPLVGVNAVIELLTSLPGGSQVITGPYDLLSRKLEDGDAVQSRNNATEDMEEGGFSVSISTQ